MSAAPIPAAAAAGDARAHRGVALLAADPEFATGIPQTDVPLARRALVLARVELEAGDWAPHASSSPLLIVDGLLSRDVLLCDRVATQLLGPGDLVHPGGADEPMVPGAVRWTAHAPVTAAVLDRRFWAAARRWPSLALTAQGRLAGLADRLAFHLAVCQLPRVEDRLLALLWHLAERFGRVTPDGVVVRLMLTHRLLGQLAGAQRSTVTLAMKALEDHAHIVRRADGALVLSQSSRTVLGATLPAVAPVAPVHRADASDVETLHTRLHSVAGAVAQECEPIPELARRSATLRAARRHAPTPHDSGASRPPQGFDVGHDVERAHHGGRRQDA